MLNRLLKCAIGFGVATMFAAGCNAAPPPLQLEGAPKVRLLTAADFSSGKLRGFQILDVSNANLPADSYFPDFVATGANLGRAVCKVRRCKDCGDYVLDDEQIKHMDYFVSKARTLGFWIVFDMVPNGDQNGDLWRREDLRRSMVAAWKQ